MKRGIEIFLHLFYWVFVIWIISVMDFKWEGLSNEDGTLWPSLLYGMATNALIFYGNAFFLYPKLNRGRKKKTLYWVIIVFGMLFINYVEAVADVRLNAYYNTELYQVLLRNVGNKTAIFWFLPILSSFTGTLPFNLIHLIFSFAYRWGKDSIENERQKRILIEGKAFGRVTRS